MKKIIILLALVFTSTANSGTLFYRAHDANSVILGPICVPEDEGKIYLAALDFDTANLVIEIYASGDGVDTNFTYTGGNIDNYAGETPPAWGNPTTSAVEVEADDDCIRLHIRDEVLAVTSATEWTITFSDGGVLIMDHSVQVLALSTSADLQADAQIGANAALVANNLDHFMKVAVTGGDVVDNSALARLTSDDATADWDSFNNTTDSLEANQIAVAAIDSALATAQVDLNLITGGSGVIIDTDAIGAAQLSASASAEITDDWETQSQADPTGFRVNVLEVAGTSQTANDNSADINLILADTGTDGVVLAANSITATALADTATAEIWAVQCEDQSGGYTCREAMSLLLAEAMGTCVYTSSTRTWVCKDPSGTETRFTVVYGTDLDGDRDTSTPAPMTP